MYIIYREEECSQSLILFGIQFQLANAMHVIFEEYLGSISQNK
jgi:hypothetical protein